MQCHLCTVATTTTAAAAAHPCGDSTMMMMIIIAHTHGPLHQIHNIILAVTTGRRRQQSQSFHIDAAAGRHVQHTYGMHQWRSGAPQRQRAVDVGGAVGHVAPGGEFIAQGGAHFAQVDCGACDEGQRVLSLVDGDCGRVCVGV